MLILTFDVKWKTETIGWVKDVDFSSLQRVVVEKKVGEIADVAIDRVHRGIQGTVKTVLHECSTERLRQMCPWAAATGSFALSPTAEQYSEYTAAGPLLFHPRHLAANVVTDDITFIRAFPKLVLPKADNKDYGMVEVEWNVYMDQAGLVATPPTYTAWWRGTPPT